MVRPDPPRGGKVPIIKTLTTADGRQLKARKASFKIIQENWSEYALEDGTTVRIRSSAVKILQVLDDKGEPARNEEGDPLLVVNHRTDVVSSG
jgi:hypothetical protein